MTTLLVSGDSFTYGSECTDLNNRWSKVLANNLGLEEVNLAQPGSSNARNTRVLVEHCLKNDKPEILCMLWTFPSRHEYRLSYEIHGTNWVEPSCTVKIDDSQKHIPISKQEKIQNEHADFQNFCETLYKHTHDEQADAFIMYKEMQYLQNFCKAQNIKYVPIFAHEQIWGYKRPYYMSYPWLSYMVKGIDSFYNFDGVGYVDWCKLNNYDFGPFMHPLDEANIAAGNYLSRKVSA